MFFLSDCDEKIDLVQMFLDGDLRFESKEFEEKLIEAIDIWNSSSEYAREDIDSVFENVPDDVERNVSSFALYKAVTPFVFDMKATVTARFRYYTRKLKGKDFYIRSIGRSAKDAKNRFSYEYSPIEVREKVEAISDAMIFGGHIDLSQDLAFFSFSRLVVSGVNLAKTEPFKMGLSWHITRTTERRTRAIERIAFALQVNGPIDLGREELELSHVNYPKVPEIPIKNLGLLERFIVKPVATYFDEFAMMVYESDEIVS